MNCQSVREELELLVLDGLQPREKAAVRAHLASCPSCRAMEAEYRELIDRVQAEERPAEPGRELRQSIGWAARRELTAARRRARRLRAGLAAASIAALLVLTFGLAGLWQREPPPDVPSTAAVEEEPDAEPPAERWQHAGAQVVRASSADEMLVRCNTIFLLRLAEFGSNVAAVDAATGATRWQSGVLSFGHLADDEERVFCLSSTRPRQVDLVALDKATGEPLWRFSHSGIRPSHAAAALPIGSDRVSWTAGDTVHLLDARSGDAIWSHRIEGGEPPFALTANRDRLYVFGGGMLTALDARSGDEAWQQALPVDIKQAGRPTLAIAGRHLYISSENGGQLVAFDTSARRVLWHRPVEGGRHLLAHGDAVYVRGGDRVRAFDGATGDPTWARPATGCGPMTLHHGRLCYADTTDQGRLVAVDPATGAETWQIAGVRSCDGFLYAEGTGYFKTQDGIVHAIAMNIR